MMSTVNREQERKECLFCGALLSGRKDKKYCDDNCRNNHYYNVNRDSNLSVKSVNATLLRNRFLLKSLCNKSKVMVKKQELEEMGFDFDYITSLYKTKKDEGYRLVYDYAYKIVGDKVLVMRY